MRKKENKMSFDSLRDDILTQETVNAQTQAEFEDSLVMEQDVPDFGAQMHQDKDRPAEGRRRKKRKTSKKGMMIIRIIGFLILLTQIIASVILTSNVAILDILPGKYMTLMVAVLVILALITIILQIPKKTCIGGGIFGLLISIVLIVGCVYLARTHTVLETVTVEQDEEQYKVDSIVVAVLTDDIAESMDDALLYNFGILKTIDRTNTDTVIAEIEADAGLALSTTEYDDFSQMLRALKKGDVQAIIYNSAYVDTFEENDKDFTDEIRVLNSHEVKTRMYLSTSDLNVTQEPFTVYISGIDVYGEIEKTSRSDVNMLVTVNPQTKKIVMTTTPRDYYVLLPEVSGTYRDKLTHAGLYGVDCSMATLSQLYGIQIDYYVRVNFTTLKKIVDALGGVNVYSEYEFTTHYKNGGYDIKKGYNQLNGKVALAFARERYNLPGGDEQRGRNQQAMLKAMIEKACSPAILTGYMGIMNSLEGSFETNMSMNQIASLVKMQLSDGAGWDIEMQSVTGTTGSQACYSAGYQRLSVMYENLESITKARNNILAIGGVATEDVLGRFSSPDGSIPLTDMYGNVIGYNTEDGYYYGYGNNYGYGGTAGAGNDMISTTTGTNNRIDFDSSLGDFASSPTLQDEDGIKQGFDYYKGGMNASDSNRPEPADTQNTGTGNTGTETTGSTNTKPTDDDLSDLDAKIESEGTKYEQ